MKLNPNDDKKKGKKTVRMVEVEIKKGSSKEEIVDQITKHIKKAVEDGDEDHRGHGCPLDPGGKDEMAQAKKVVKEVKMNAEELKIVKELEEDIKEANALLAKADIIEARTNKNRAKLFAMVRVRENDFLTEGLYINRDKGTIEFFEKAFSSDK